MTTFITEMHDSKRCSKCGNMISFKYNAYNYLSSGFGSCADAEETAVEDDLKSLLQYLASIRDLMDANSLNIDGNNELVLRLDKVVEAITNLQTSIGTCYSSIPGIVSNVNTKIKTENDNAKTNAKKDASHTCPQTTTTS